MFKNLLLKFHSWLGIKLNIPIHVCPESPIHICPPIPENIFIIKPELFRFLPDVEKLVIEQESIPDVSGEYKRHQVYSRLIKNYSFMPKHEIALAIEIAITNRIRRDKNDVRICR